MGSFQWPDARAKSAPVKARAALLLVPILIAGCGERGENRQGPGGSTTPPLVRDDSDPTLLNELVTPVRIGELGANFAACNGRGAVRERGTPAPVPVRSAPYDQAGEIDRLEPGAEFFICARSQDQRWFGIVYDEGGRAAERCGVAGPVAAPRSYLGPCAAGWVASAGVNLVSGVAHQLPPAPAPAP
jgi:hypothetical protein